MAEEKDEDELSIVVPAKSEWQGKTKSLRLEKVIGNDDEESPTWDVEAWVSVCVLEVDTQKSQFKCDLELEMVYFDESLKKYQGEIPYEGSIALTERQRKQYGVEETMPRVMLENCDDPQLTYFNLEVDFQTGRVYMQHNWVALYREVLELERFPFDRQLLRIYIEVSDVKPLPPEEWAEDNDELPFQVTEVLQDFKFAGYRARWKESLDPAFEAQCHISVEVQRKPTFYLFNFMFITFLVVLLNSASISLGVDSQERLAYSANLVLTLVAFKFVIVQNAPVISYMTLLDKYNFMAFVVLVLGTFQHALVSPRAALLFGTSVDDMNTLDIVTQILLLAVWIVAHVLIAVLIICGGFYKTWEAVYAENAEGNVSRAQRSKQQKRKLNARKTFWERANRLLV